jgi:hypothetical protein
MLFELYYTCTTLSRIDNYFMDLCINSGGSYTGAEDTLQPWGQAETALGTGGSQVGPETYVRVCSLQVRQEHHLKQV